MEIKFLTLGENTDRLTKPLHDRLRRVFGPGIGNVNVVVEPQVQTYVHHQDSAHGWIEVPMHVLRDLGIAEHISAWSYRDGDLAYLEEDDDASLFRETMRARGIAVRLIVQHHTYSPVSNFRLYWAD